MDSVKTVILAFVSTSLLTGCQMGYYFSSAYHQVSLLSSGVPVQKALLDPKIPEETKGRLRLAHKVRQFNETDLKLKQTKNFTKFVQLDRPYVTYVVSASPKWELKHHLWKFPVVGKMPYKGFFIESDAQEEAALLKSKNLDTHLRGVSAYSTLGWFNDPILSSMFNYKDFDLVNTLIHETVHTTIFIKNSADFNERMAVFLGNKGMELFYIKEEGPDSPTLNQVYAENHDDKLFSDFISREIEDLKDWYKNQTAQNEDLRQTRIKEIQTRFVSQIEPQMKSTSYSKFRDLNLNNARLMLYKTYMQDLSDFEKLYDQVGRDFSKFIEACRKLESHPKPEEGLKELISLPQKT
jgi:predicted aminopeptidase